MNVPKFTVTQAAEFLGADRAVIYARLNDGLIPGEKIEGRWYVDMSWVLHQAKVLNIPSPK